MHIISLPAASAPRIIPSTSSTQPFSHAHTKGVPLGNIFLYFESNRCSHRLKEKINCSADAINNINIKIREARHEAAKLRDLENISEEGKEKFAVIADRIQQNVEKMLLEHTKESKVFQQNVEKLNEMNQIQNQGRGEFPTKLWNSSSYYKLNYTDSWESLDHDDPRLSVISYDCMLLSNVDKNLNENVDNIPKLIDKINGVNTTNANMETTDEASGIETVISYNIWQLVTIRMLSQLKDIRQFQKACHVDRLDTWWRDRKEIYKRLKDDIGKFENENINIFEDLSKKYFSTRNAYSKKHAYDSDFLKWMQAVLPPNADINYEGKVLEVGNFGTEVVNRQDVINVFSKYGTVLLLQIEKNVAKVCMQNPNEVAKIMEIYSVLETRKEFSIRGKILSLKRMHLESERKWLAKVGRDSEQYLNNRIDNHEAIMKKLVEERKKLNREKSFWTTKTAARQLGLTEIKNGNVELDKSTHSIAESIDKQEEKKPSLENFVETSDFFFSFGE